MTDQLEPAAITCRGATWRFAFCFAISLAMAAITTQPSWAEGVNGAECPTTASAMKGQKTLRSMAANVADGVQILAIGSSTTEGVGASSSSNSYPSQLEAILERLLPGAEVAVYNAGIGGETADTTVARVEEALRHPEKPDLIIWQVGTNDAIRGGDEKRFQELLERGIAAVQRAGVDLILMDQQFYPTIPDLPRYERYVEMVSSVADRASVGVFSRYRMMRTWAASSPSVLTAMLSKDQFHMGDQGYRCLAQALSQDIASVIAQPLRQAISVARGKRVAPGSSTFARRS